MGLSRQARLRDELTRLKGRIATHKRMGWAALNTPTYRRMVQQEKALYDMLDKEDEARRHEHA